MPALLALHRRGFAIRLALLALVAALAALAGRSFIVAQDGPDDPPEDLAEEAEDFDGDEIHDPIAADPEGEPGGEGGIAGGGDCEPGRVSIYSGADGSLIVRFYGRTCGDQFGHHLAVIRDLNLDGFDDLLIGAPTDETGHAFAFLGPFRDTEPIEISAENADFDYFSPDGPTGSIYDFGERVSPVSDLDGDDIAELRFRGWTEISPGVEEARTYIASGVDGFPLYVVKGNVPFDPWAVQDGDVDGDGDVDALDLALIHENIGMTSGATIFEGDVDGDGDVDNADYAYADGLEGQNMFTSFLGTGDPTSGGAGTGGGGQVWICPQGQLPAGTQCIDNCWGFSMFVPENVEPLCEPITCQAWCGFAIDLADPNVLPIDSYQDVVVVEAFGGLNLDQIMWEVLDGEENIDVVSDYVGESFEFHLAKQGIVKVKAVNDICTYVCEEILGLYLWFRDSDGDGMPDVWEIDHGLNPNDPGDGTADADGDGISNYFEFVYGTDPNDPSDGPSDSDGDTIPDVCEQAMGTNPFDPNDPSDPNQDTDGDGIPDSHEICGYGTNPNFYDSDGDAMPDAWEIQNGYDPTSRPLSNAGCRSFSILGVAAG